MTLRAETMFSLRGKTALLTGASGFLGRTMARALLANGARLIAMGRSKRLSELARGWAKEFGHDVVRAVRVDMEDLQALRRALKAIAAQEPAVDVLVNNAHELSPRTGFNTPQGALERSSLDQWALNLAGGVYWPLLTVQTIGAGMTRRGRGSIINVATMYALVAPAPALYQGESFLNPPGYSAAKAAMLAFTRYVAAFWGPAGVRCNAIVPGAFSNTREKTPNAVKPGDEFLERLSARTCLRRIGRPEDLAGALVFLASDASAYVTGHALVVDGGWTIT